MPTSPTSPPHSSPHAPPGAQTGQPAFMPAFKGRSPAAASDAVWTPLASGVLVLAAGAMSLATGQPWLSAGLGPSALSIAATPGHTTTRFHAVVLGHLVAFLCGVAAVVLLGAGDASVLTMAKGLPVVRVWASALGVALTALVQPAVRAYHPPAAATALLVTLGVYRVSTKSSLALMGGVLVVALLGEWLQRVRMREMQAASARA